METIPDNFLGLPPRFCDYRTARFAILPIPYDSTTSFQVGTRNGPRAIITASQQVELFDEELRRECHTAGIATLPPLAPEMAGPQHQVKSVYEASRRVVRDGKFLIGLGGEHSITSGEVKAVRERFKKLSVLQIDAHADLRDEWEGTPYSHACVMRRIYEMGVPIVQVGIRNYSKGEADFIRKRKPVMVSGAEVNGWADGWIQRVLDGLSDEVFVTIDIDGFDPAYAPGTGTPEPGGMNWHQVTGLLREVAHRKRVVGADIVEVMPLPGLMQTEFLAAKLAYKLIAYSQVKKARSPGR